MKQNLVILLAVMLVFSSCDLDNSENVSQAKLKRAVILCLQDQQGDLKQQEKIIKKYQELEGLRTDRSGISDPELQLSADNRIEVKQRELSALIEKRGADLSDRAERLKKAIDALSVTNEESSTK